MERQTHGISALRVAEGLGWISIGLGLAEIVAPQQVARLAGIPPTPSVIATLRSMGGREVANGVAILAGPARRGPSGPAWPAMPSTSRS